MGASDIIQVNVNREAWQVEYEQVQSRSAFENKPLFQKWMTEDALNQVKQMNNLFHNFRPKPCGFRLLE
ncbi:MAG: hypothetical protein Q8P64_17455 [Deltaproteobacteria bacterium]|nr:hypothetical protein [Deltaproteobacteria bacterium]